MPELPEVETTRRGIERHLLGRRVTAITLRRTTLRWPIPADSLQALCESPIQSVRRRAKYLLIDVASGSALLHLGMSGMLRVLPVSTPVGAHDHVDLLLDDQKVLRFTDPRRFGCLLWQPTDTLHPLLRELGPEPFDPTFSGDWLFQLSRGRRGAVKPFLMDQSVVVGVGNIYAAEALFEAGIDPRRAAGRVALGRYRQLATAVRRILGHAIERGGTTLRDFLNPEGAPGYFEQELLAYGREGLPCRRCGRLLRAIRLGQRSTAFCPHCQR